MNGNEIVGFQNDILSFQDRFELSFLKLYNFFKSHKQCVWNRDILESSYLCEVCENGCECQGDQQVTETKASNQSGGFGRKIFVQLHLNEKMIAQRRLKTNSHWMNDSHEGAEKKTLNSIVRKNQKNSKYTHYNCWK